MAERQKRNHKDRDSRNSQESNYESNFSTDVETMEMRRNSLNEEISVNASPDTDSFNWDEYENGGIAVSNKSEMDVLYSATIKNPEEKVVIMGTVVAITDKDVVLDIGFKSDGLVSIAEFKYRGIPEIGEEVEIIVESKEDKNGQILISHKKAQAEKSWNEVVKALEEDRIVQGYIKDRTKGGMIVDLMGLEAFLPGSQLDIKPIKDYDDYVGKTMDLKIVKINPIFRNIVVSHKAIIENDLELQKVEILGKLEKGQVLEGVIKNLTSFGVFVDLGGVDGLIHITDISWGRVNHPEEVLEVGQKINIVVLDYDEEKKRISLGMKQLTPHPWDTIPEDVVEGSKLKGKVVNIEDYGAFIEIFPGVEGLVHVSEMSWSTHLKSPQEYVKLNDEVDAVVLSIDREERKLSLGLKQLHSDPWANIDNKYDVGTKHNAVVRSMTNFGLFVELEEGIDGLVHISDLSWTKKFSHPAEFTKVGEKLDIVVLDIDKETRRLSLGHKQLEEDPWETFESIFLEGSIHQGVIHSLEEKGAVIGLPYGVEAFAPKKHMSKADKSKAKVDETLDFKVIEFDKANKKIIVSHTDIWKEEERKNKEKEEVENREKVERTKKDLKKVKDKVEKSTLADELDILAQLKSKMEEEDKVKQQEAMAKMDAKSTKEDEDETAPESSEEAPAE
jgi:small subunit ribosomal protein S1